MVTFAVDELLDLPPKFSDSLFLPSPPCFPSHRSHPSPARPLLVNLFTDARAQIILITMLHLDFRDTLATNSWPQTGLENTTVRTDEQSQSCGLEDVTQHSSVWATYRWKESTLSSQWSESTSYPVSTSVPSMERFEETGSGFGGNFESTSQLNTASIQQKGCLQLWRFLIAMLDDPNSQHLICWTGRRLEFKLNEPEEVARLWGIQKNRPTMNYDKLSRSLRYYYEKGIIQKVSGERYVYRFAYEPEVLPCFSLAIEDVHSTSSSPTMWETSVLDLDSADTQRIPLHRCCEPAHALVTPETRWLTGPYYVHADRPQVTSLPPQYRPPNCQYAYQLPQPKDELLKLDVTPVDHASPATTVDFLDIAETYTTSSLPTPCSEITITNTSSNPFCFTAKQHIYESYVTEQGEGEDTVSRTQMPTLYPHINSQQQDPCDVVKDGTGGTPEVYRVEDIFDSVDSDARAFRTLHTPVYVAPEVPNAFSSALNYDSTDCQPSITALSAVYHL
ncbi:unnamed protein product [Schistocephalus solidus]|uniref:ETS domain-containing protein n=1 Tax=Schistocephalus solidus TaxID=70667 RepID=A0A183SL77_SCHSO|nr:unnamed protein product [Schistocephalus solidus]